MTRPAKQRVSRGPRSWSLSLLLLNLLLRGGLLIEVGRLDVLRGDAKCRFKDLTGLQTVSTGVALGLDCRLALRRDGHLDDAWHQVCSILAICRSARATDACSRSTVWKAR